MCGKKINLRNPRLEIFVDGWKMSNELKFFYLRFTQNHTQ